MPDTALVIMARYPVKGNTKTRLARSIGDDAALALYTSFVTDLAQRFSGWQYDLYWAYTPPELAFADFISSLTTKTSHSFAQQGADLAARLLHAFTTLQTLQYEHTVLIGSDTPHISRDLIIRARAALSHADVVLGPAEDGGYYLIAMRQPYDLFTGIPMSTAVVLTMTQARAQAHNLSVQQLEPLFDIDELPELLRLKTLLAAQQELAPVTAACLEQLTTIQI